MKQGMELQELAQRIKADGEGARDYIIPVEQTQGVADDGDGQGARARMVFAGPDGRQELDFTPHARAQYQERLGVPGRYADRILQEHPALWQSTMATLAAADTGRAMVRVLDGRVRAVLSDRYRRIDHRTVADAILPALQEHGATIKSCNVSGEAMYIKAVFPTTFEARVREVGQVMGFGVRARNSEIGLGAAALDGFAMMYACTNGMVVPRAVVGMRAVHLGRRADDDGIIYSSDTMRADEEALRLRMRDVVRALADPARGRELVARIETAAGVPSAIPVARVAEVLQGAYQLSEGEGASIVEHLARGGDTSRWGLVQAITRSAEDAAEYDRASDIEALGGRLLHATDVEWRRLEHLGQATDVRAALEAARRN